MKCLFNQSFLLILLISLFTSTGLRAQEDHVRKIMTAVPFLRLSPDARSGGMGDAGIALSPNAFSSFYNPSKVVFAEQQNAIGATYTPWLRDLANDVYLATLAGYHQVDENQAISGSLRYFTLGEFPVVDYNGNMLSTSNPREWSVDASYARKLSSKFSAAVAMRYIRSALSGGQNGSDYQAGNAVAGDISFYYNGLQQNHAGWTAGLSLSNLGTKMRYDGSGGKDFLPANAGIGIAYNEVWDAGNSISFVAEANKLLVPEVPASAAEMGAYHNESVMGGWVNSWGNRAWQFGFGTEFKCKEWLFLRLGYQSKTYGLGNWQYMTTGIGAQFGNATVNFSYQVPGGNKMSRHPQSNTVGFSASYAWTGKTTE